MALRSKPSEHSQKRQTKTKTRMDLVPDLSETLVNTTMDSERFDFSKMVKILVGPDGDEFFAHPHILLAHSYSLDAVLSGRWGKETMVVKLKGEDPEIFNEYLKHAYEPRTFYDAPEAGSPRSAKHVEKMVSLWILADFLGDSRMANHIMYEFLKLVKGQGRLPSASMIESVFNNCSEDAESYKYVRDIFVSQGTLDVMDEYRTHSRVPKEFFYAIARQQQVLIDRKKCHEEIRSGSLEEFLEKTRAYEYYVDDDKPTSQQCKMRCCEHRRKV